ncbi:hypothetical protein RHO15_03620 [Utexia brackfieldae]|uniref:hypothetical protein n=1 Tax=Utexia brackfieldae TaxID=3074108 RepID=UPI00370D0F4B
MIYIEYLNRRLDKWTILFLNIKGKSAKISIPDGNKAIRKTMLGQKKNTTQMGGVEIIN